LEIFFLGVGNIPANINPAVLRSLFQSFGHIESIRILSHKNCGFVNFERQEDAVRARKSLQNKEILGPGTGTVRIGFAKAPANNPDEVIQDVVISGNTITSYPAPPLPSSLENQTPSSQQLQEQLNNNSEVPASNTTQWATVLLMASMMMNASTARQQESGGTTPPPLSNIPSPSSSTQLQPNYHRLASERKLIMQQLGYEPSVEEGKKKKKSNYLYI
jgi:RNA recognition motif-containing protein